MPRPVSAGSTPAWASEDFPAPLAPRISRKARPRSALPAACSTAALIMALRPKKMGACLNRKPSLENAVRIEPVSASKFPASREKNREFCGFRPSAAILASNRSSDSMACRQIPYATEQGIFGGITGNFFQRTGNSRAGAGNSTSLFRWTSSLACTASKRSRSRMAGCSPGKTSPLKTTSPI